jgi:hypothetical protein
MNLKITNFKSLFLFFFLIISCFTYSISLKEAYKVAGKNQVELKALIEHYSKNPADSLKKKSAIFLIENMDGHFSYKSSGWTSYNHALDSLYNLNLPKNEMIQAYNSLAYEYENKLVDFKEEPDLKFIKADYLIRNIDSAFVAWQKPYAKSLNFNQFCEYLLPYRIGNEELSDWRELYGKELRPAFWKKAKFNNDSVSAYTICNNLRRYFSTSTQLKVVGTPDFSANILFKSRVGTCQDWASLAVFAGRALGIPVSPDYAPHWGNRSMGHDWNSLNIDNKKFDFGLGDWIKIGEHYQSFVKRKVYCPKVFRTTYSIQTQSLAFIHADVDIPFEFISPFMKDVSMEYFPTVNIDVDLLNLPPSPHNRFAYICVFDNAEWVPAYWSAIQNQKALFKAMNRQIIYLPAYYIKDEFVPANYPIQVNGDSTTLLLKPNLAKRQTVTLTRKYTDGNIANWDNIMVGGLFQVSNDSTFKTAKEIYKIQEKPEICFQTVNLKSDSSYRYFRYVSPPKSYGCIAEIELYGPTNIKLKGKAIGTMDTKNGNGANAVFDGNVLTWFNGVKPDNNWIGLEFETPQTINKIVYLPRNDDNFIRDGELYELFFWDNKWISLGKQTGSLKTQSLTYTNVPTNALFLLKDLSRGQEERIFTYESGKQVWW